MKISIPKETIHDETRVAATPQSVKELIKTGYEVDIETCLLYTSPSPRDS